MEKKKKLLFYSHQSIDKQDIDSVVKVLKGDWLTTGPIVDQFEKKISEYTGSRFAVCCSSGTAGLILSYMALGKNCKNYLIPSMTFVSTVSSASLLGKNIDFVDCNSNNGLIDFIRLEKIVKKKKIDVIVPVHMNGKSVELEKIYKLAKENGIFVVDDASHAIGSSYKTSDNKNYKVGSGMHSDMTVFSFHPVKNITTGEGGAITTNDHNLYQKLINLRNHGIERKKENIKNIERAYNNHGEINSWYYEVQDIGYNFRLSDINCALGLSQFKKLDNFKKNRSSIVKKYCSLLKCLDDYITPVNNPEDENTAWHLFVVKIKFNILKKDKDYFIKELKKKNIQTQVHYIPVHFHPFFSKYKSENLKATEAYYDEILSLPLHPQMNNKDVEFVVESIKEVLKNML